MTETWASILIACAEYDQAAYDNHAKLRRLASLLEQITPEMAEWVNSATTIPDHMRGIEPEDSEDQVMRLTAGSLLQALSTAPTEETEDR